MQNARYAELFGTMTGAAIGAAVVLYGAFTVVVTMIESMIV